MSESTIRHSVGRPRRILHRPKISWPTVLIFAFIYLFFSVIVLFYLMRFPTLTGNNTFFIKIVIVVIYFIISLLLFLKKICIFIIKLHQRYAPDHVRKMCNFEPSCSEYAILAINKYGVLKGIFMSYKRIKRCVPPGGIDYP